MAKNNAANSFQSDLHFQIEVGRFEDNPDVYSGSDLHTINFFEIIFISEGVGVAYTNEHRIDLSPGTILFASPKQVKRCVFGQQTVKGFHVIFKPEFLGSVFQDSTILYRLSYFYNYFYMPYMIISKEDFGLLNMSLKEIISEIAIFRFNSQDIIRSLLYGILLRLDRLFREFHHIGNSVGNDNLLTRFRIAIEEHIFSNLNCNQYADVLKVHRNELNRKIKMYTGYTAIEILHHRKILEIKSRLLDDEQSIAEIAYDFHFSNPNNLSRFFKKATGESPLRYRQKMRKNSF
ncbi:MAG: hypothetical protein K0R59_94 [Sphingobacterium sp.]|jgi:AraC-like DNA-binding protein|nr:hypothetical protein [Sphingobacterium sp.]